MAAWVPGMFSNFYLVKNYKIANNSRTTEARKKLSKNLDNKFFKKKFDIIVI
jgi:hypothetical protein